MKSLWTDPRLTLVSVAAFLALGYLALREDLALSTIAVESQVAAQAALRRQAYLRRELVAAEDSGKRAEQQAQNASASGADANDQTIHLSDVLKEHPEYAALFARKARRRVWQNYGSMLRDLGIPQEYRANNFLRNINLPPDQRGKLIDLLVERDQSMEDASRAATSAGLDGKAGSKAVTRAAGEVEQQITALLGTDSGPLLQKLEADAGMTNQIRHYYAPEFDDAGVSLSPDQSRTLAATLAAAASVRVTPAEIQSYAQANPATEPQPWENHLLDAAAVVLSPAQLQILRTTMLQDRRRSEIMNQYMKGAESYYIEP